MLTINKVRELSEIFVDGFLTSPKLKMYAKFRDTAVKSLFTGMWENREDLEKSLARFHNWLHSSGIGEEDYNNAKKEILAKGEEVHKPEAKGA